MLPDACLPATGIDNWTILLLVGVAMLLIVAGVLAVKKAKGRLAMVLAPLAILGLVVAAPASPAQALETAIPNYSFSDTWTVSGSVVDWDALSENATGQALIDSQTLYDMEVDGSATKTVSLVAVANPNPGGTYTFPGPTYPWSYDDTDFSVLLEGSGPGGLNTAFTLLQDNTNVAVTLTFTYDYEDQCGKPLQTVLTYTGSVTAPQPVP